MKIEVSKLEMLKELGVKQVASTVKVLGNTKYYNVNTIDSLIANGGKWIAAPICNAAWQGRYGTIGSQIDWSVTVRLSHFKKCKYNKPMHLETLATFNDDVPEWD